MVKEKWPEAPEEEKDSLQMQAAKSLINQASREAEPVTHTLHGGTTITVNPGDSVEKIAALIQQDLKKDLASKSIQVEMDEDDEDELEEDFRETARLLLLEAFHSIEPIKIEFRGQTLTVNYAEDTWEGVIDKMHNLIVKSREELFRFSQVKHLYDLSYLNFKDPTAVLNWWLKLETLTEEYNISDPSIIGHMLAIFEKQGFKRDYQPSRQGKKDKKDESLDVLQVMNKLNLAGRTFEFHTTDEREHDLTLQELYQSAVSDALKYLADYGSLASPVTVGISQCKKLMAVPVHTPIRNPESANRILTFEQFSGNYNNITLYFGTGIFAQSYRKNPLLIRFEAEYPELASRLQSIVRKGYVKDFYEFYKIMRGYGATDYEILG